MDPKTLQTWLPLLVIAIVFGLRYRSLNRPKPFRPGRLWIVPSIIVVAFTMMLIAMPPTLLGWMVIAAGLAIGAALGWKRGHLMHLERDPSGGGLLIRQSPAALLLLIGIVLVRRLLSAELGVDPDASQGGHMAPIALLMTDGLLGFGLGMVIAMNWTLWQRARTIPPIDLKES